MAIVINGQTGIDAGHLPISNAGNTEIEGTLTGADVTVASITANSVITQGQNVSPFSGFKNYIINGNFDVWQRNTSGVSTSSDYTADMWKVWAAGAYTNWSRASSADFDSYSKFVGWGLKWYGDAASVAAPIEHRVESINAYKLSGKKVTLSFLAKCSANASVNVVIGRPNAVDNFSGTTAISAQTVNLTTTTQKFSVTFDLTNTDVRNGLYLTIHPSVPSAFHWIAQVQLEEGSVATPFENRPYGLELSLCQYFLRPIYVAVQNQVTTTSGQNTTQNLYFPSMRTTPTVINKLTTYAGAINASSVASVTKDSIQYEFYYGSLNAIGAGQRTDLLSAEL